MNTNLLLTIIAVLGSITILQGAMICFMILNRKKFSKKMKRRTSVVKKREKTLREQIANLFGEIEKLEKQVAFYKGNMKTYKEKASEYAYAMEEIIRLYQKACTTISEYVQAGLLIKSFSESKAAYEDFLATWRDLQIRKYVQTYNLRNIIEDPEELEFLFGTSDMGFLSEVFEQVEL